MIYDNSSILKHYEFMFRIEPLSKCGANVHNYCLRYVEYVFIRGLPYYDL